MVQEIPFRTVPDSHATRLHQSNQLPICRQPFPWDYVQLARYLFTDPEATSSSASITTSSATKNRSVGSSSGTHFGEWRSGSLARSL